jgi:hypothetical protein
MTRCASLTLFLLLSKLLFGQALLQDWSQTTKTFDQEDPGTIKITITGVNPFLYDYATEWSAQDQSLSDFSNVQQFLKSASASTGCDLTDVETAIKGLSPKNTTSIPLKQTQDAWNVSVKPKYDTFLSNCKDNTIVQPLKDSHDKLFPSGGVSSVTATVQNTKPCKTYVITIHEFYQGTASDKTITATVPVVCEELTFSAGTLLTEVPSPTYNSRPSPTQSGNFLSIEQTGKFRPTVVGLLNYNFPGWKCGSWCDPFRVGVSTGPVFQSAQSGASSFGAFLGGSLSIYKRLYLSGGEHWGEFGNTPFGFSNGSPIPANFGQLTPRLRYTARFAFGITFRTNDISKAFSSSTSASTTAKPK